MWNAHGTRGRREDWPTNDEGQTARVPSVDAVKLALERERQKRKDIKPIELLKVALSAYLAFTFNEDDASATGGKTPRESTDSAALRRGTQAAVDRLLFNANYWRAAYESRIFDACTQPEMPSCACRPFRFGRRTPSS
mgnify:CR=1 FL=1